ncbi:MAG: YajQ family cyclic di-GMP-binding protein [Marinospirillum sp.]|uniref:YajQ family cyclic di-GMP-binding protein n=1 Tax=Marinospirillum sp. TaxID=2183934 RepID=UPI0019F7C81E|nr:YajQ family cyclic di-GMP-binding protein [Marinospirillum sp.]MBE0506191.1 YajQ family cyclic di-GMP-binding protein [Marinospirillum sp.]
MPSFDVVSELDKHQVTNAIDQANRLVGNRFDFKGVNARFEQSGKNEVVLHAEAEFQVKQMLEILQAELVRKGIDISCLEEGKVEEANKTARMPIKLREGIETELAKKIVKMIKDSKIKVQAQIQGDQVRVTGKKRDDLQQVMALLRGAELEMPLQYINFRD